MKTKLILATVVTSLMMAPVQGFAFWDDIPLINTSPEVSDAKVNFLTGGVGDDERAEIEAAKADFNLHITSARTDGAFVEDIRTVITRKKGKETEELLNVASGPLLYVQLEPGSYTVESTRYEVTQKKTVVIGKGKSKDISFTWKPMVPVAQ